MRDEDSHDDSCKIQVKIQKMMRLKEKMMRLILNIKRLKDLEEEKLEEEMMKSSDAPQEMQDDDFITNREFEKSVQQLTDTAIDSKRVYANLPKTNLENTIITYKQI